MWLLVVAVIISVVSLFLFAGCVAPAQQEEAAETAVETTESAETQTETVAEEPSYEEYLTFYNTNRFPEFWGKVRVVEPSLATFTNIKIEVGEGILEGKEAFAVSGELKGEQAIDYCINPEQGILTSLSAAIIDRDDNMKWSQDGSLQEGTYLKAGEIKQFILINSIENKITEEDILILVAHVEYGMIEDDMYLEEDIDKGIFAEFNKEIKNIAGEVSEEESEEVVEEPKEEPVEPVEEEAVQEEPIEEKKPDEATLGEKNAAKKALDYLAYSAFSYSGLVEQLEYEGYTHEEAVYGVDKCGADWNEQAAKKAQDYLDYSSFSRDGLIAQLEYEGFTRQQAEYGAQAVGY